MCHAARGGAHLQHGGEAGDVDAEQGGHVRGAVLVLADLQQGLALLHVRGVPEGEAQVGWGGGAGGHEELGHNRGGVVGQGVMRSKGSCAARA